MAFVCANCQQLRQVCLSVSNSSALFILRGQLKFLIRTHAKKFNSYFSWSSRLISRANRLVFRGTIALGFVAVDSGVVGWGGRKLAKSHSFVKMKKASYTRETRQKMATTTKHFRGINHQSKGIDLRTITKNYKVICRLDEEHASILQLNPKSLHNIDVEDRRSPRSATPIFHPDNHLCSRRGTLL